MQIHCHCREKLEDTIRVSKSLMGEQYKLSWAERKTISIPFTEKQKQILDEAESAYAPLNAKQHAALWCKIEKCQQLETIVLINNNFQYLTKEQFQIIIDTLKKLPKFRSITLEDCIVTESQYKILDDFICEQPDKRKLKINNRHKPFAIVKKI